MENTNYDENLEQNEVDNDYEPEIDEPEIDDASSSKTISEVNKKKEVKFGIILLRMRIIRKLKKLNAIIVEFLTLALMEVRLI